MDDPPSRGAATQVPRPTRFRDAMPRPMLAAFAAFAVTAVALALWLIIRPPQAPELSLAERRPPPAGALSHGVGEVVPAPVPDPLAPFTPPCPALGRLSVEGGAAAVARLTAALEPLCRLAGGGVAPEIGEALRGLDRASIRFASFTRTGVDATADPTERRIWLNLKFARSGSPTADLAPVILHEAIHLVRGLPTAGDEIVARRAESAACRELIRRDQWPRGCDEASALAALEESAAIALLTAGGYRRQ